MEQALSIEASPARRLDTLMDRIERDPFLAPTVMELRVEGDMLVALTGAQVPPSYVRHALERLWKGPVEAWCPAALFAGCDAPVM